MRFCNSMGAPVAAGTGFPDASNTGVPAGTSLTPSGSLNSSSNGQTIDALDISGLVTINHNNVTVKRCRITSTDSFVLLAGANGHSLIVEDCELFGLGDAGNTQGVFLPEATAGGSIIRRCNIHSAVNGILIGENAMQIRDNYIHDLDASSVDAHIDGIQGSGGFTSLTIDHNHIIAWDTSCIILKNEGAAFGGVVINNNKLIIDPARGGSVCVLVGGDLVGTADGVTITNNRMRGGSGGTAYGQIVEVLNLTWTGNVDDVTGATVNPDIS